MSVLNLWPARIRWCNPDGTLTPEAVRMLEVLVNRVGGAVGDSGIDVFATAALADGTAMPPSVEQPLPAADAVPDVVLQSPGPGANDGAAPVQQQPDYRPGTALQLVDYRFSLKDTLVTPGTYGLETAVASFEVDQQGRLLKAENVPIKITMSQISDIGSLTIPADRVIGLGSLAFEDGGTDFSGSFTGKTVTVINGIITQVV